MMRRFILVLLSGLPLAATASSVDEAWERLGQFEFNALADELERGTRAAAREVDLVRAIAELNRQPRSAQSVTRAAELLDGIIAAGAEDDIGRWARYWRARVDQLHRSPADPAAAAAAFRRLLDDLPAHPAAQRALPKLAVLLLYVPEVEPDRDRGFAAASALLTMAAAPEVRAELHLLLGRAAIFHRRTDAAALRHLEAAVDAGIATPVLRASALYALGDLAREGGRRELARRTYQRFLAENPRDSRTNLVRERLAAMEGAPP